MKKKIVLSTAAVVVIGSVSFLFFGINKPSNGTELPKIKVTKGTIVDKALAVGTIEPENEISVKSKVSGVVSRIYRCLPATFSFVEKSKKDSPRLVQQAL